MAQVDDEVVKRALGVLSGDLVANGDAIAGISAAGKTTTYELEKLGGTMLDLLKMAVNGNLPILCDSEPTESLLIMNKCYGTDLVIPVKDQPNVTETLHVFSMFLQKPKSRRQLKRKFHAKSMVYLPSYGGIIETPDGIALKPCIVDIDTREIMCKSDMGWRSLLYVNQGPDDPFPTGIVAIEGWKFVIHGTETEATIDERKRAFYSVQRMVQEHYTPPALKDAEDDKE